MEEHLKKLMQNLGNAINESLSDSEAIAGAIGEIKGAGYDVFLILEATIGLQKPTRSETGTVEEVLGHSIQFRVSKKDLEFFPRGSGIKLEDEDSDDDGGKKEKQ